MEKTKTERNQMKRIQVAYELWKLETHEFVMAKK